MCAYSSAYVRTCAYANTLTVCKLNGEVFVGRSKKRTHHMRVRSSNALYPTQHNAKNKRRMQSIQFKTQGLGWLIWAPNQLSCGCLELTHNSTNALTYSVVAVVAQLSDASVWVLVCACMYVRASVSPVLPRSCNCEYACVFVYNKIQMDRQETGSAHLIWFHSFLKTLDWCALCLHKTASQPAHCSACCEICVHAHIHVIVCVCVCARCI